ncbi:MAG: MerR family transcriptional regulator [Labilithrix sp.]|nr:MerR family transcriptional regulator [Labilithrix sp.]MBX3213218.1 MerR family transcriptional regulator [Labilithrix sp.]
MTYKLDELARAAGTSARTVRYYVQRGLLPPPAFRGKDSAYGHEHLVRLRAIRRLQDAFLPLDAIAVELARRTVAEIERVADGRDAPRAPAPAGTPPVPPPPARQIDAPPPSTNGRGERPGPPLADRTFRRIELAPGVELSVADDAPLESRRLADQILEGLQSTREREGARR